MRKRIVVLMEGSGNAFDSAPSNVTRTLHLIALGRTDRGEVEQRALWDYGVGTRLRDLDKETVEGARAFHGVDASRLTLLAPPRRPRWMPRSLAKYAGLAFGLGLVENVAAAVEALAPCYEPADELFLLGFSRGAFTIRVLAALLWRFGLPEDDETDTHQWVHERLDEMQRVAVPDRTRQRSVPTHFLGLWDTVKSYGFIRPVRYFHLRHNPGVNHVRHALALDEKRSWFQCTTWGGLDRDRGQRDGNRPELLRAWKPQPNPGQTVREVWFRGCHSDVGGGGDPRERSNAEVALRWMLNEARMNGLVLNRQGAEFVAQGDPPGEVTPTESRTLPWRVADYLPRLEIDNDYSPGRLRFAFSHTGDRRPCDLLRDRTWKLHRTAGGDHSSSQATHVS